MTLGGLLYAGTKNGLTTEREWVELAGAIAQGDRAALRMLYGRTRHVVFTLILRIVYEREVAEEPMLDVFHQVWRRAPGYGSRGGSVVGWVMDQARVLASERAQSESRGGG